MGVSAYSPNHYVGNGAVATYTYGFKVFKIGDLDVKQFDLTGVKSSPAFTATGIGDDAGGTITLTAGNLTLNHKLAIRRVLSLIQETNFKDQKDFFPEGHENQHDKQIMIVQHIDERIKRSFQLSEEDDPTLFNMEVPAGLQGIKDVVPLVNPTGVGWAAPSAWPTGASIISAEANAASAAASALAAAGSAGMINPYLIHNIGLLTSVAASALTIALKQADASTDPSTGTASAGIYFRSSTAATGSVLSRVITGALSIVVPSGATLGHASGVSKNIYVYALDNAGVVELAISSLNDFDEGKRHTTTVLNSSSDSDSVLYSASARTNVGIRLLGRLLSNQTVAGTWDANMTEVHVGFLFSASEEVKVNFDLLENCGMEATVAANALTFKLKQLDGVTDPTSGKKVRIAFRSATGSLGGSEILEVNAPLSITVPSGATLGLSSSYTAIIYLYAINNSGTIELAVSASNHHGGVGRTFNTTLLDTSSDDSGRIYSASAENGIPFRLIGHIAISQSTPGTWASGPSPVEMGDGNRQVSNRFISLSAGVSNVNVHNGITYIKGADSTTYNLQLPAGAIRFGFTVKRSSGGASDDITIVRIGSESIEGVAANYVMSTSLENATFLCTGVNWHRIL